MPAHVAKVAAVSRRAEAILALTSVLAVASLVLLAKYRWHLI
jgi:hypothetical protein